MELERKTYAVELKHDEEEGVATFIASVFDILDSDGDIVDRGAFRRSLKRRTPKFVADHKWEVSNKLGRVLRARETKEGLEVTVKFGLHNPLARQVYEDFKFDSNQEFSFGFTIPDGGTEYVQGVRHIKEANLFEVSNVLIGANPATRLVGVKADEGPCDDCDDEALGLTEEKAADTSAWDGNAAMTACSSASCYRAICAGRREGDPAERGTWALPHHKRPGAAPNANGVRNALARLGQTEGLVNKEAARRHLERHMASIREEDSMKPEDTKDLEPEEVRDPVEETPEPEAAPEVDATPEVDYTEERERARALEDALLQHIVSLDN